MIRPNDIVLHKPSGEKWVVCGVDHSKGELILAVIHSLHSQKYRIVSWLRNTILLSRKPKNR